MNMTKTLPAIAIALMLGGTPAFAQGNPSGAMKGSHSGNAMTSKAGEAAASAVINSIDVEGGKINVTHDPFLAIGWPKMTMDLPVTKRVDLASVKPGSNVTIKLKLGRDKQYRIIEIMPVTN